MGCDKSCYTDPSASGTEQVAAVPPCTPQRGIPGDATCSPLIGNSLDILQDSGKAKTTQNKAMQLVCPCLIHSNGVANTE